MPVTAATAALIRSDFHSHPLPWLISVLRKTGSRSSMNRNALFIAPECYNNRYSQRSFYGDWNSQKAAEDSPGSVGEGIGAAAGEVERCAQYHLCCQRLLCPGRSSGAVFFGAGCRWA